MSLTRAQWIEMWSDIKILEDDPTQCRCEKCREKDKECEAITRIKDKIESVIGQMRTNGNEL